MNPFIIKYKVSLFLIVVSLQLSAQNVLISKVEEPVESVNLLMETDSNFELSNGNVYSAMALPWGMISGLRKQKKWEMAGRRHTLLIK